ncbi:MAG: adenine phosphoribosyltransferase [Candidatus Obscuribacterales bacterium]|nr:adenine phosphoribosyltransferase [Candidatus Obscuribacterales bacterium]
MTEQATYQAISPEKSEWLKSKIRDIPDFPKPGIVFKDLTTLLKDKEAFGYVIDVFAERFATLKPNYVAGIEARGFILAPAIAHKLNVGFIPVRKPGKLPYKVVRESYQLEYGTDTLEVHEDCVSKGERVILIDDLLATGGTAAAAYNLLTKVGADVVSAGFVVELAFLEGRKKMPKNLDIFSIISF